MPTRAPTLRAILRTSTSSAPPPPNHAPSSPPPPYHSRSLTILAPTHQWTRFQTPTPTPPSAPSPRHPASLLLLPPPTSSDAAATIDAVIEEIQDLYGTARDEFEIAAEETEKNTTYAADDRAAAREDWTGY
ncbi:hypothetical protein N0V90_013136 [Kalmusia sp. IMI 367209]|nr:hypothetical protein N0V90_013136 [Kalmusia sp. IMI 367209]